MRKIRRSIEIVGIVLVLAIAACTSQIVPLSSYADSWIGQSIDDLILAMGRPTSYASRIGWQEKIIQHPNGDITYLEPVKIDCQIHWKVNKDRIIVSSQTVGTHCY